MVQAPLAANRLAPRGAGLKELLPARQPAPLAVGAVTSIPVVLRHVLSQAAVANVGLKSKSVTMIRSQSRRSESVSDLEHLPARQPAPLAGGAVTSIRAVPLRLPRAGR